MFTDSGTGDRAAAVFYTVPALPSPGRYALRLDVEVAGHDADVIVRSLVNGVPFASDSPGSGGAFGLHVSSGNASGIHAQELLLADEDELSFDVQSAGNNSYTWQVEFRLCRMPEDIL